MRQAIIWTNVDMNHWRIYAALRGDELKRGFIGRLLLKNKEMPIIPYYPLCAKAGMFHGVRVKPLLLMPWLIASPGHQQPWHWPWAMGCSYLPWELISPTYDVLVPRNYINTLRPKRNGQHFADNIFKRIFLNENAWISTKISLDFVPKGPINSVPALVQIWLGAVQATSHYLQ